jgi:hypothetical protein
MKNFKCKKCNLVILNPVDCCRNCGAKAVEYKYQEISKHNFQLLEEYINNRFEIVGKKPIIERLDEGNFHGFEYELQRPI